MSAEFTFAVRRLLSDRSTAAAAILAVALGSGLNVAVFVVCCATIACYLPARRASHVDPAAALRDG